MQAYIVIAYIDVNTPDGTSYKLYDDTSEKFFSNEMSAINYSNYLSEKGKLSLISPINIIDSIDVMELRRNDALAKLTDAEKTLLNLI